jgi:NADH-quinone oxidoreductase subunit N
VSLQQFFYDFYFYPFAELFLAVFILLYIFYAVAYNGSQIFSFPGLLSSTTSFTIFAFIVILISLNSLGYGFSYSFFQGFVVVDFFTLSFKLLLVLSVIFLLLISKDYLNFRGVLRYEYDLFLVFSILGLFLLSSSDDFLIVYMSVELQGLCFYVLATFQRNSEFSTEAGVKYFVLGAFSSGLLLLGFLLLYLTFGTTSFVILGKLAASSNNFLAFWGSLLVIFAFFFKIGAVPFHLWLCDVYESCLTSVSAFFSVVPKLVLFSVLTRFYVFAFAEYQENLIFFFLFSGFFSVCLGSVAGLYQKRVKRLIAYSTVSHTGFILLGVSTASVDSVKACFIYLALYALSGLAIFSVLLFVGTNKKNPKYLLNWAALSRHNSLLAITFSLLLLSAAGIPPLSGFYSKFSVLFSLVVHNYLLLTSLVILFSSVGCFYYVRLIKLFFFASFCSINFWFCRSSRPLELFLALSSFIVIFFLSRPVFLDAFAAAVSVSLC